MGANRHHPVNPIERSVLKPEVLGSAWRIDLGCRFVGFKLADLPDPTQGPFVRQKLSCPVSLSRRRFGSSVSSA